MCNICGLVGGVAEGCDAFSTTPVCDADSSTAAVEDTATNKVAQCTACKKSGNCPLFPSYICIDQIRFMCH